jgi:NADH-ubiquinone oxidoreductase chain 1
MESELVSGFMTEHSAIIFVFFFLAEYASIILISILTSILFLGGYLYPFHWAILQLNSPLLEGVLYGVSLGLKTCLIVFGFIWVRASFPRIRYDQLMSFC